MGIYFLDTSAIVKRYVPEQGRAWIMSLCDPVQGHDLYIAEATLVEAVAAMCKKARIGNIHIAVRNDAVRIFRQHCQNAYGIITVSRLTYISAGNLCLAHNLRAYDAIQLACVLQLRNDMLENGAAEPIFACSDIGLLKAANAEGLSVEDPNDYP